MSFIASILILIFACNDSNTATNADDKNGSHSDSLGKVNALAFLDDCKAAGSGNFIIHPDTAKEMIDSFAQIYRHEKHIPVNDALVKSVWIDKCIITALGDFLEKNKNIYDGIEIYNCAYDKTNGTYPNQHYDYESSILLQLTKPNTEPSTMNKVHHINVYDKFPVPNESNCVKEFKNYNLKKADAEFLRNNFDAYHRESGKKDSLSQGVWFDRCVITSIAKVLKNDTNLDGLEVLEAAYNKIETVNGHTIPGQIKNNQSTLVLIVSKGHQPDWNYLQSLIQAKKIIYDAYNHGELCPDLCNGN